jgi:hypothetical protein
MRAFDACCAVATAIMFSVLPWSPATAQSIGPRFAAAGQLAGATSSEFDGADLGFGGLFIWRPAGARFLATEAEMNIYPSQLAAGGGSPFSRRRIEGLFGVTVGPTFGRVRPIAKFRPGFVWVERAPGALACPAIYPPILSCELAGGKVVLATDVGGGIEVSPSPRTMFRFDLGDRMMAYPGPAIDANGHAHPSTFYEHELRFNAGVGVRF